MILTLTLRSEYVDWECRDEAIISEYDIRNTELIIETLKRLEERFNSNVERFKKKHIENYVDGISPKSLRPCSK